MAADNVNHPAHYETGKFECIEVMIEVFGVEKVMAFCELNAFKYLYRCENKNAEPVEDWQKAQWYLNKAAELSGKKCKERTYKEGVYAKKVDTRTEPLQLGTVLIDVSEYFTAEDRERIENEDILDLLAEVRERRKKNDNRLG